MAKSSGKDLKVFIGHKSQDELYCLLLAYLLESHGIPTWHHSRDGELGRSHTVTETTVLIKQARAYILIVTGHALANHILPSGKPAAQLIENEWIVARGVTSMDDRPKGYKAMMVLVGLIIDNLDGSWMVQRFGNQIESEVAALLPLNTISTEEAFESWVSLLKAGGPPFESSPYFKIVDACGGTATFTQVDSLQNISYKIRSLLKYPGNLPVAAPPPPQPAGDGTASRRLRWIMILLAAVAIASVILVMKRTEASTPDIPPLAHEVEIDAANREHDVSERSRASAKHAARVRSGQSVDWTAAVVSEGNYALEVSYSNDGGADKIVILVDGRERNSFETRVTGERGEGWNQFTADKVALGRLDAGARTIQLRVVSGDEEGVELDRFALRREQ